MSESKAIISTPHGDGFCCQGGGFAAPLAARSESAQLTPLIPTATPPGNELR